MDHRSHQCAAVRRKDHDHYDRRLAGNPGVLRGGSRDRRGRLSGKASLYYAAIAASGNYHQRGIKPDRRIEAVWNHPVYDFRWTWVFLPFTLNPDQLPVLPEPERRLFRSSWALSVCDYHDPWYGCPPFPGEESGGA